MSATGPSYSMADGGCQDSSSKMFSLGVQRQWSRVVGHTEGGEAPGAYVLFLLPRSRVVGGMVEDEDEGYDDGYGGKDEADNSMEISSGRGAEVADDDILDDGVKGHTEVCARQLPDILFFNLVHVVGALLHGVGKE